MTIDSIDLAKQIRVHALRMVTRAKASHIGSALSVADIVAALYGGVMHVDPGHPELPSRDRFILSKGHACVAVYGALAARGFFPEAELDTYGQDHSNLMNHISHKVPGVELSSGALGHGLPFGVGKALVAKRIKAAWRVFVQLSDGEMDEGSNWEALMFAAHHRLDNLVAIIDYNKLQSITTVEATLNLEPLADKLRAFGWTVREVDGHAHAQLHEVLGGPPEAGKPTLVLAHTVKGKGVSFMENQVLWHYRSPSEEQLAQALAELEAVHA
jgi:transketolase